MAAQPSILAKSGTKGLENIVLLFLVFQGQFGQKVYFCYYEFGLITKYFLPKPLRRTNMTMQNLLLYSILQNLFHWPENLGETWQQWFTTQKILQKCLLTEGDTR